jgi:hypothetical protein
MTNTYYFYVLLHVLQYKNCVVVSKQAMLNSALITAAQKRNPSVLEKTGVVPDRPSKLDLKDRMSNCTPVATPALLRTASSITPKTNSGPHESDKRGCRGPRERGHRSAFNASLIPMQEEHTAESRPLTRAKSRATGLFSTRMDSRVQRFAPSLWRCSTFPNS